MCSNQIENCTHFFFHCYLHAIPRERFLEQLRLVCTGVDITTDVLLFGSELLPRDVNVTIFSLVEDYILETGRF